MNGVVSTALEHLRPANYLILLTANVWHDVSNSIGKKGVNNMKCDICHKICNNVPHEYDEVQS